VPLFSDQQGIFKKYGFDVEYLAAAQIIE